MGIQVHNDLPGAVPEYEILEALTYCGYTLRAWHDDLDWDDRANLIAQYRIHFSIESHVQDAINRAQNRAGKRRG